MEIRVIGSSLEEFIDSLEKPTIAKVSHSIDLLEEFGNKLYFPHTKKVFSDLFELRIHGKQEIRIFYTFHKSKIFLLHGFRKKSQKIPKKQIRIAIQKLKSIDTI